MERVVLRIVADWLLGRPSLDNLITGIDQHVLQCKILNKPFTKDGSVKTANIIVPTVAYGPPRNAKFRANTGPTTVYMALGSYHCLARLLKNSIISV